MSSLQSIGEFLSQYNDGTITAGRKSRPTEGDPPPTDVQIWFDDTMGTRDQHVIPLNIFEFRIDGEDQNLESNSDVVRYSEIIGTVEHAWDDLIADYGFDALSTYVPFHEDPATYGVYIRQQGIRFLGHLLYEWSRVQDLTDKPEEYSRLLQKYNFQSSNRLLFEDPAFESVEEAFDLAREMVLRYQWFRHQTELLAAYLEDATGSACYSSYWDQMPPGVTSAEAILSKAYVARSSACRLRTPSSKLYKPLFERVVSELPSFDEVGYAASEGGFNKYCSKVVAELTGQSGSPLRGVRLAEQLPFETDVWSAVPWRLPVYVTRNEFDTDNGSYGVREMPLDPDWEIETSDTWNDSYERAEGSLRQRADNAVNKLENNVRHSGFNWKPCTPENRWYFRLNQDLRGVANISNQDFTVELVDFGDHSAPSDYGCWE